MSDSNPALQLRGPAMPYMNEDGTRLTFGMMDGCTVAIVRIDRDHAPAETLSLPHIEHQDRWKMFLPDGRLVVIVPAFVVVEYPSDPDLPCKRTVVT